MSDNLKVAIIGAGMAGILAAIKLKEFGIKNITIFEKGGGVGGTWRDNSYPGLHCDVPPIITLIVLKEILSGQIIIPLDQRFVSILREFFLKMILIKFAYSILKS